ncbi:MAG: outer membrane protein assembly factor BamD [Chlamydiia bacterium]|nr:outer membrane protein assembly factor BamD [Chlamydiia bacterium]MCP5509329.1 outer membrane protein assembly factor BamD [Chlamydiales bacterium]HPE85227.1 outer membrane protein assembly factor BamD [Chlamydiales bacterium]
MKILKTLLICLCLFSAAPSFSAKKDASVHEFYSAAQEASQDSNWSEVIKNGKVVVTHYSDSPFAPEALFLLAVAYFETQEYEQANKCFTEYLKKQTTKDAFEQAIRYKFEIARNFEDGAKMHLMGWQYLPKLISAKDFAIEIYDEVIATLPRHELASEALYRKASLLFELEDFKPSIEAYQALIRRFPKHHRAPESYIGIAKVYLKQCETEFKDPDFLDLAEINMRKFEADFPTEERLIEAKNMLLSMKEKYAGELFETGQFFERTKKAQAAALYYHSITTRYPETNAAAKAEKRLQKLSYTLPRIDEQAAS